MSTMPCYHVTTNTGSTYGVAAPNKTDARRFVADRLAGEQSDAYPVTAERVGTWTATFGTVLAY